MKKEDLLKFKEDLLDINITNLQDEEFMRELTNILIAIGDIFAVTKLPKTTYPIHKQISDLRKNITYIRRDKKQKEEK
jgi:hypothetical protein